MTDSPTSACAVPPWVGAVSSAFVQLIEQKFAYPVGTWPLGTARRGSRGVYGGADVVRPACASPGGAVLQPSDLEVACPPSAYGAFVLARALMWRLCPTPPAINGPSSSGKVAAVSESTGLTADDVSSRQQSTAAAALPSAAQQNIPKMVNIGLNCLFTFVHELNERDAQLCSKALTSLLSILESLGPSELQSEQAKLVADLYDLLTDLATSSQSNEEVSGLACASMLALGVARAMPEALLQTAASLIALTPPVHNVDSARAIAIPTNFASTYRLVCQSPHQVLCSSALRSHKMPSYHWMNTQLDHIPQECVFALHTLTGDDGSFLDDLNNRHALAAKEAPPVSMKTSPTASARRANCALTCDGHFLYLLCEAGLLKIGTGCGDTMRGHIYARESNWLQQAASPSRRNASVSSVAQNQRYVLLCRAGEGALFAHRQGSTKLLVIDTEQLQVTGDVLLPTSVADARLCALTSELAMLRTTRDSTLEMHTMDESFGMPTTPSFSVKLTRNRTVAFGEHRTIDVSYALSLLKPARDERLLDIQVGHELALLLTERGHVYYLGRGSNIGMQDCFTAWSELLTPEPIAHMWIGQTGSHVLLQATNGQLLFTGIPSKGEDGERTLLRRQAQPVKCKPVSMGESKQIVSVSANAGSTFVATADGCVYAYGKDTYCSEMTGIVQGHDALRDPAVQVSAGKAHAVILSRHGNVLTFGMNTFGQCGRLSETTLSLHSTTGRDSDSTTTGGEDDGSHPATPSHRPPPAPSLHVHEHVPGMGGWCSRCAQCTAHGLRCPRRGLRKRYACEPSSSTADCATPCLKCGACKACIASSGAESGSSTPATASPHHAPMISGTGTSDAGSSSNLVMGVGRIDFQQANPVPKITHVSCGNYHTILLSSDGRVFTFGNNRFGQLGAGDCKPRTCVVHVDIPAVATMVTAGGNHCVVLTTDGRVFTFGRHSSGQLGREASAKYSRNWYALPGLVDMTPSLGTSSARPVWVSASGDVTFVRCQQSLLSRDSLLESTVVADARYVIIFPRANPSGRRVREAEGYSYLVIDRSDGSTKQFRKGAPALHDCVFTLDGVYGVLWAYDVQRNLFYSLSPDRMKVSSTDPLRAMVFDASLWLPIEPRYSCSVQRLGFSALTLCYALFVRDAAESAERASASTSDSERQRFADDYQTVDRFQGFGGGWGYSNHSVEAVQFMCERTVFVIGFGLLGGRGEYVARLRLLRLAGEDGEELAGGVETLAETEELPFESWARDRCQLFFKQPVLCSSKQWYTAWVTISGPASDCGSGGQPVVRADDGCVFHFRNSFFSNNGTDVRGGQIGQILYKQSLAPVPGEVSADIQQSTSTTVTASPGQSDAPTLPPGLQRLLQAENPYYLSVSSASLISVLRIVSFCVQNTLQFSLPADMYQQSERLVGMTSVAVKLMKILLLRVYPANSCARMTVESKEMVELVEECFQMIVNILSCCKATAQTVTTRRLLCDCVSAIASCFHIFFPCPSLVRTYLMSLLHSPANHHWLLCSFFTALSQSAKPVAFLLSSNTHAHKQYPMLMAHLLKSRQLPDDAAPPDKSSEFNFNEFLPLLFRFVFPDRTDRLRSMHDASFDASAALFHGRPASDLSADSACESGSLEDDLRLNAARLAVRSLWELVEFLEARPGRRSRLQPTLLQTPPRFAQVSHSMAWDNGAASDAIAFSVDSTHVAIHGAGVYVGFGDYNYTLELCLDCGGGGTGGERWETLEKVAGTLSTAAGAVDDIAFIKLHKPVKLVPGTSYAMRLMLHGGKSWGGEAGLPAVVGCKGVRFMFSTCSLSENGTTSSRGQIPILLYSFTEHPSLTMTLASDTAATWIVASLRQLVVHLNDVCSLVNEPDCIVSLATKKTLLSFITQYFGIIFCFLDRNPRYCLDCFKAFDELLPLVVTLNRLKRKRSHGSTAAGSSATGNTNYIASQSTAHHQIVLESSHPYKPSSVHSQVVQFCSTVSFMSIEFDTQCCTAQSEDSLQIYVSSGEGSFGSSMSPVVRLTGAPHQWPKRTLLLPGNTVWLVLESAANYSKIEDSQMFGYKCIISGISLSQLDLLEVLECELSTLYAYSCSLLLRKNNIFPSVFQFPDDLSSLMDEAADMMSEHGSILRKGLRLGYLPSVYELQTSSELPALAQSAEMSFIRDFMQGLSTTTGGKLARWLTSEPYIDAELSDLHVERDALPACSGQPVVVNVTTRDQCGRVAYLADAAVEIIVTSESNEGGNAIAADANMAVHDARQLISAHSYQPTYINKARYVSVSMMKAFERFSFEELRVASSVDSTSRVLLNVSSSDHGSYCARFTPPRQGSYKVEAFVDGIQLLSTGHIDVTVDGRVQPRTVSGSASSLSAAPQPQQKAIQRQRTATVPPTHMTAGVRIRSSPQLTAEQVGLVDRGAVVGFVEQTQNADGTWLRLSDECALAHCAKSLLNPSNTWMLQYHAPLQRELLTIDAETVADVQQTQAHQSTSVSQSVLIACAERYVVVRKGGVELLEQPAVKTTSVGRLPQFTELNSTGWLQNDQGVWIMLHCGSSLRKYLGSGAQPSQVFVLVQDANLQHLNVERIVSPETSLIQQQAPACLSNRQFVVSSSSHRLSSQQRLSALASSRGTQTASPIERLPSSLNGSHRNRVGRTQRTSSVDNRGRQQPVIVSSALKPSLIDTARTVFAVLLWHDNIVHDAMACASYLKFHHELSSLGATQREDGLANYQPNSESAEDAEELAEFNIPLALRLLTALWREVSSVVYTVISQHLIMPSPPMALRMSLVSGPSSSAQVNQSYCELCEGWFAPPVTLHMRLAHPGCGGLCGGQGYNSMGRYTSGWTGNCGDGGQGAAAWYLLCSRCQQVYLRNTVSYRDKQRRSRGRSFRTSSGGGNLNSPQVILKQNALFLLEINGPDAAATATSPTNAPAAVGTGIKPAWAVNLFPQTLATSPTRTGPTSPPHQSSSVVSGYDKRYSQESLLVPANHTGALPLDFLLNQDMSSHFCSDPGPKRSLDPSGLLGSESSWPVSPSADQPTSPAPPRRTGRRTTSQNLIASPSPHLQAALGTPIARPDALLIDQLPVPSLNVSLKRPVVSFVVQHHNISRIRHAMQLSLVRTVMLTHGFQVLSWLIRLVHSPEALHSVLYYFIDGLSPECLTYPLLRHPLSLAMFAGQHARTMMAHMYNVLLAIANLLANQQANLSLEQQRLCLRAWMIPFIPQDQVLIVRSRLLKILTQILSGSFGTISKLFESDASMVLKLSDITPSAKVDASSRKAMVPCLLDGTTETFWESGEDDRARSKYIYVECPADVASIRLLALHIDNVRDASARVSHVCFSATVNRARKRLLSRSIDLHFVGWVKCAVPSLPILQVELKGPDMALRVRQIVCLGTPGAGAQLRRSITPAQLSTPMNSFNSLQEDAFRLLRLLADIAFGVFQRPRLASAPTLPNLSLDLVLTDRVEQPLLLQQYLTRQILLAVEKDAILLRDEVKCSWSFLSGALEMLDHVLVHSTVHKQLSERLSVVSCLADVLPMAPARLAMQILKITTALMNHMHNQASATGKSTIARVFDNVLTLIAKSLTIQMKDASARRQTVTTLTACVALNTKDSDCAPHSWRLDRSCDLHTAQCGLHCLATIVATSTEWSDTLKAHIAQHILSLLNTDSTMRTSTRLSATRGFWLMLASLCALQDEEWLSASPLEPMSKTSADRKHSPDAPLCDNHDDGATVAAYSCAACGGMNLCRECNAIFHLNRRNRKHPVRALSTAVKDELSINVRDSCVRLKLGWLMVLIDSRSLNGIVEFRDEYGSPPTDDGTPGPSNTTHKKALCRYCHAQCEPDLLGVCTSNECQELVTLACNLLLDCGHLCGGCKDEQECMPCLQCKEGDGALGVRQDGEDMCMICFSDTLSSAPCVQLSCSHIFHYHCVLTALTKRYPGPRVSFGFMCCPICKKSIEHPSLKETLAPLQDLYEDVSRKCLMRLEYENLTQSPPITDPASPYHNDPTSYAIDRYAYYVCYKCGKTYFGGEAQCQAQVNDDTAYDETELVCGACSDVTQAQVCPKHGTDYLEYKCRYCCSIAIFFCFGTTHFCAPCHDDFQRLTKLPRSLLPPCPVGPRSSPLEDALECPLKVAHPPTGEEFALGCGICRNVQSF